MGKIESCRDNNVVVWRLTMNLVVQLVLNATANVKNVK